jgi:hypothetical protein
MPVLIKLRAKELEPQTADAAIQTARERVLDLLKPGGIAHEQSGDDPRPSLGAMQGSEAMEVLARRLNHIEHAARKVARLAARPVLENI